ncbi:MAG: response regulator [Bacteroidota bacterium]
MDFRSTYQWKNRKILVVEDDESSSFLINEILKNTGANLYYTLDGEEAIDFIRKNPGTDLILMDVNLPVKDGFTATREIKHLNKRIVVIAQTAYAFAHDREKAKEAGCDDFMTKPLNPYLLLAKIDKYLS